MAYYPIKCPYCLLQLTNKEVRFNLGKSNEKQEREVRETAPMQSQVATKVTDSYSDSWDDVGGDTPAVADAAWLDGSDNSLDGGEWMSDSKRGSAGHVQSTEAPTEGFYTYSEIVNIFGQENVRPLLNKEIYAPPALRVAPLSNEDIEMHLLTGVEITTRIDGVETKTVYRKRFCECGKGLMNAAGMKASYVLLMMGPTSSGKTMFLVALHKALRQGSGYTLPPRGSGSYEIADLSVTVLSGGDRGEDTSLEKMADELIDYGKLPLSTFALDNEPLVLDVFIDFRNNRSNGALLFVRDMPGEFLTNPDKTEELYKIANQFSKFDGFIMMLDPFTFTERSVFHSDGRADTSDREKLRFVERLNQILTNDIIPLIGKQRIDKPTAVIVTKGDHFFDPQNKQRLIQRGVEFSLPTLTIWQKESYDKQYFDEVDKDSKRIISSLSPNVANVLKRNFSNVFCSLVSSLSKEPMEIVNRDGERGPGDYVVVPNAINPWRVSDPFIRMLMQLNIVPPFDEVEIRTPDGETRDQTIGRNTRYLATINAWGRLYCSGWEDLAGFYVMGSPSQLPSQQQPQKSGGWLFGKKR
ncbi:MAG: hypothetical protein FWE34_04660 [Defluviitaleaceae bacterium]|nr:hypothetical protein [Defluviitaleaceae bacterium]